MSKILLRMIDFKQLRGSQISKELIGLANAANDIATASNLLTVAVQAARAQTPEKRVLCEGSALHATLSDESLLNGYQLYCFRMLLGHYSEGAKVLDQLRKRQATPETRSAEFDYILDHISKESRAAYDRITESFAQERHTTKFENLVRGVRDSVSFHYTGKEYAAAVQALASGEVPHSNKAVVAASVPNSRLVFADTVLTTVICKEIWKVDHEAGKTEEEAVKAAIEWCSNGAIEFLILAQEICFWYIKDKSGI